MNPAARLRKLLGLPPTAKVEIVTPTRAEASDAVVCMRVADMPISRFPDDVVTDCQLGCGHKIRHRPYMPKTPMKICTHCALAFAVEPRQ